MPSDSCCYLCVGLAHALVQGLVVVDGGLQHLDVAVHRLDLTASRPAVHVLHILESVKMNFIIYR